MPASFYMGIKFTKETPEFLLERLRVYAETANRRVRNAYAGEFFGTSPRDTAAYPEYLESLGLGEAFDKNVIELDIYACIEYLNKNGIDAYEKIPNLRKMLRNAEAMKKRVEKNLAKTI